MVKLTGPKFNRFSKEMLILMKNFQFISPFSHSSKNIAFQISFF